MAKRAAALLLLVGAAVSAFAPHAAASSRRVEVIEVAGIIDGSVERAVGSVISQAEREKAQAVIVQIDSRGAVDDTRGSRMVDRIVSAKVPVVVWVPSGGHAENTAALLLIAAHYSAMAPSATLGPIKTFDLRSGDSSSVDQTKKFATTGKKKYPFDERISATTAERRHVIQAIAPSLPDLLDEMNGKSVRLAAKRVKLATNPNRVIVRVHKIDLFGRMLHAAAQPSVAYLLILGGLVGIVFELFHPSNGPAGVTGLAAFSFGVYGIATLGGSWPAFVFLLLGILFFCIDLRYNRLGGFTVLGEVGLIAGSLLLFTSPYLHISPWILALGIAAMNAFLLGAMTRVLRDLRAIASGEMQVKDAHPHPE